MLHQIYTSVFVKRQNSFCVTTSSMRSLASFDLAGNSLREKINHKVYTSLCYITKKTTRYCKSDEVQKFVAKEHRGYTWMRYDSFCAAERGASLISIRHYAQKNLCNTSMGWRQRECVWCIRLQRVVGERGGGGFFERVSHRQRGRKGAKMEALALERTIPLMLHLL